MSIDQYLADTANSIADIIKLLDVRGTQFMMVVDDDQKLLGTVTDGDIRRCILSKVDIGRQVHEAMNPRPLTVGVDCSPQQAESMMKTIKIHHLPVVDASERVVGIFTQDSFITRDELPNTAVLMLGGKGTRLGEMTKNCPKPMLRIAGKPIVETTLETLRDAGFRNFVFAVNYLSEKIIDYFGDGEDFGVSISYLHESEPLGTAGALRQLELDTAAPFLVMNGDILTRVNYAHLLRFHEENSASATMCVREYKRQVPFGVVELNGHRIEAIEEKPMSTCFINSGIYVLNPETLHYFPPSGPFNMPNLFDLLNEQRKETVAFPIREYWADIGQPEDLAEAKKEFSSNFN